MSLEDIETLIETPPPALTADNLNVLKLPDNELSFSSSHAYSESGNISVSGDELVEPKKRRLKKRSTKSRLMKLMKLSKEADEQSEPTGPICVTFRRAILCPYFSPLILYREIKKAIQNHAISLATSSGDDHKESESKSYRKQKPNLDKLDVQKWLQQSGITAITSPEFRKDHFEIFWNLAWHFSNLRLPIYFLRSAFENEEEMDTPAIDDLIQFVPLETASADAQ